MISIFQAETISKNYIAAPIGIKQIRAFQASSVRLSYTKSGCSTLVEIDTRQGDLLDYSIILTPQLPFENISKQVHGTKSNSQGYCRVQTQRRRLRPLLVDPLTVR